jgi:hypothetical protein
MLMLVKPGMVLISLTTASRSPDKKIDSPAPWQQRQQLGSRFDGFRNHLRWCRQNLRREP